MATPVSKRTWGSVIFGLGLQILLAVLSSGDATFREFNFTVEPNDIVVQKDHPAILNCSARGYPTPTIGWKRDNVFLSSAGDNKKRYIMPNGSLHIHNIEYSRLDQPMEGPYQCVATYENLGSIASRYVKVQVATLPRFEEHPKGMQVFPGQTARFACSIPSIPPALITWYKDDQPLALDRSRMLVLPSGALEIDLVQSTDMGTYKCKAENSEKSKYSETATLTVSLDYAVANMVVAPDFISQPKDRVAKETETITLDCAANGNPKPTITWLKDGTTIDMADLDSRFSQVGVGSLRIENLHLTDSGVYMCRAENHEDSVDASANVEVQVPPRFIRHPNNKYAYENEDIEFECELFGKPDPTIQWMKNGDLVVSSEYFQILNGRNLKILGLVSTDAGLYQCFGTNPAGNIQSSAQLIVLTSPNDNSSPTISPIHTPHSAPTGTTPVQNVPPAPYGLGAVIVSTRFVTLSWRRPDKNTLPFSEILSYSVYYKQEGSNRERVVNSTVEEINIQGLRPAARYIFRVVAYNNNGPGNSSQDVLVETHPEVHVPWPPINVRATVMTPTVIKVHWELPEQRGVPILKYKIYYSEVGTDSTEEAETSDLTFPLRGLKKFTEYSFNIVALNSNGPGMPSEEVSARTYSDLPSEPPQNVTLEAASSTSIIVRWEPPTKGSQNGVITGYKLRHKLKGSKRGDTVTTDGNRRLYALNSLERGAEYSVRIAALTVNGSGPATEWMSIETFQNDLDESRVPDRPGSLRVRPLTDSIVVSWTPPRDQYVMVRGYTIGWGIGIPDVYSKVLDSKQRYYTIEGLQPSSEYVISLRAYNSMGDGIPIYETVKTRIETTPEPATPMLPPVGLKAIVLSSASVVLTWTDTTLPKNQRVNDNRYYTIRYLSLYPANSRFKYINATDLNTMLDDLKPNTQYEFAVKVVKGRRESTWSLSVQNTTYEAAPGSHPRDLTVVEVENNPTAINLNWQPPRSPNGQITGYVIFYTTDKNQRDRDWVVEGVVGDKMTTTIKGLTPDTTYYFKIQARNNMGYGPLSNTISFTTSRNMPKGSASNGGGEKAGLSNSTLYIIIACVVGVTLVAIIVVMVIMCRRRGISVTDKKKKGPSSTYKVSGNKKGSCKDINPPDLWIHHDQMELKQLEKPQQSETTMTVTPIRRNSQDLKPGDDPHLDKHTGTYIGNGRASDPPVTSDKAAMTRRPVRPKPITIPVDSQQPPPREPIATATPIPNGHLAGSPDPQNQPPTRPVYPRTQYNIPRAHILDNSQQSAGNSPDLPSPGSYNQQAPIPYEQVAQQPPHSPPPTQTYNSSNSSTIDSQKAHRPGHPLKSFSVPAPPPQNAPPTPQPKHIVKPQQATSPYKKTSPVPPNTATIPVKPRSPLPVVMPRAPDVTYKSGREESGLVHSYSSEELSVEMANLEGLMKDLNAITASEFEC